MSTINVGLQKQRSRKTFSCSFGDCQEYFPCHSKFVQHLEEKHSFQPKVEEFLFSSEEDFSVWRSDLRKKYLVEYIKQNSTRVLSDGKRKAYLICHRFQRSKDLLRNAEDRKRALKSKGYRGTTRSCPSRIEVVYNQDSSLSVTHWKDHLGHLNELDHCSLDKSTKENLARRLQDGVPFQDIIDDMRLDGLDNDPRVLLLAKKDLHNVVNSYNIAYQMKSGQENGMSVTLSFEEMNQLGEYSPVIFFKQQGDYHPKLDPDDVLLILMTTFQANQILKFDSTRIFVDAFQASGGYDFNLTTLLTVDEFGACYPVAYCFSNKSKENQITLFFEAIKEKVGTVSCNTFMYDDTSVFYDAWCKVMGSPEHKLLNSWHLFKIWRKNMSTIGGGEKKKMSVFQTLKALLNCSTEDLFQDLLTQTVTNLLNDPDTAQFGEYFFEYYACRPEQWALCYRTDMGINTNKYLESFHRLLKDVYAEGKKAKCVDKSITAVMRMARDSLFKRSIKLSNRSAYTRFVQINESHKASEDMAPSAFTVIEEGQAWSVNSSSYVINKCQAICEEPNCSTCPLCNICIHSFKCTCTENVIKMNICKHIHACCRVFELTSPPFSVICDTVVDVNSLLKPTEVENVQIIGSITDSILEQTEFKNVQIIGSVSDSILEQTEFKNMEIIGSISDSLLEQTEFKSMEIIGSISNPLLGQTEVKNVQIIGSISDSILEQTEFKNMEIIGSISNPLLEQTEVKNVQIIESITDSYLGQTEVKNVECTDTIADLLLEQNEVKNVDNTETIADLLFEPTEVKNVECTDTIADLLLEQNEVKTVECTETIADLLLEQIEVKNEESTERITDKARMIVDLLNRVEQNHMNSGPVETYLDSVISLLGNTSHSMQQTD
ncbi:uncharacterized protein LOC111050269 [Nilaparvata lugens]|uniref:uncharacterized protein LOC111050269 n=1 Tax=Nilaparvata lugens TaxID=108931 RepID=UPI00193E9B9E|nr:uncharacterized protein LOC111050269 [Nilaparvata lugens]